MERTERTPSLLEKNVNNILQSLVLAAVVGAWTTMNGTNNKIEEVNEKIIRMEEREKQKQENMVNMQVGMKQLQLDMSDMKERMTRIEVNQNITNSK